MVVCVIFMLVYSILTFAEATVTIQQFIRLC